ncbi:Hypothetical predicted protein [Octopus vulgaris]|uniref:Uncharacterized protein n=1 Tax=Octopus vulgaris TaxID=6645 RepID=A0AA36FCK4_OCTVU|nr:Hypothetical predicted protein [Octopus vulgaris]
MRDILTRLMSNKSASYQQRQIGGAKMAAPKQQYQNGIAKMVAPKRKRQNGSARTTAPKRLISHRRTALKVTKYKEKYDESDFHVSFSRI